MTMPKIKKALEFLERYSNGLEAPQKAASAAKTVREFVRGYRASFGADSTSSVDSIRRYTVAGMTVVLILACGGAVWGSTMEISGALIAPGTVVVESNIKKVQHPTGGVIGELLVRDGDQVKAGDLLVRLDDTVTRANLAIVTKTLTELYARKARLAAERDRSDTIKFP